MRKTVLGDSRDSFQITQIYVFSISQFANASNLFLGDEKFSEAISLTVFIIRVSSS